MRLAITLSFAKLDIALFLCLSFFATHKGLDSFGGNTVAALPSAAMKCRRRIRDLPG
jgi:hypothetical protein